MKSILLVLVAFFAVAAHGQDLDLKHQVRVDRASIETSSNGTKYSLVQIHNPLVPDKSLQIMCILKNADCIPLNAGDIYKAELMKADDPDSYTNFDNIRLTGPDSSTVYLIPSTKK
jgi:hypothetical protein